MARRKSKLQIVLHSAFYRVYFALVLLAVAGIVLGMRYLNSLLADYERAQPAHVAETAARLFEDADYETIYSFDTSAANIGDPEFYVENLREIAADRSVSWSPAYSPSEDERRYNVLLAGEKFAEISLVPSGEVTTHGNRLWKLGSVTTYVTMAEPEPTAQPTPEPTPTPIPREPFYITAPSESTVTVDGVQLGEQDAAQTGIATASAGLLPKGVQSPTLTQYIFYSDGDSPEIQVVDKYGNPQTPEPDGDRSWVCALPETPELKEKYEKAVVSVAQNLAKLSARTLKREKMLEYCASGSPARERVSQFDTSAGYSSRAGKFQNIMTSDYYMYSDGCFSCKVSFDYLSRYSASVTKTYSTTFTLYFVRQNGKGKLYNFTFY